MHQSRPRRVTLREVAGRAGVSPTTASFVLAGRDDMRISEDARLRVRQAAADLGYRPNLTARSLRTKVTRDDRAGLRHHRHPAVRRRDGLRQPGRRAGGGAPALRHRDPGQRRGRGAAGRGPARPPGRRLRVRVDVHPPGRPAQGAAGPAGGAAQLRRHRRRAAADRAAGRARGRPGRDRHPAGARPPRRHRGAGRDPAGRVRGPRAAGRHGGGAGRGRGRDRRGAGVLLVAGAGVRGGAAHAAAGDAAAGAGLPQRPRRPGRVPGPAGGRGRRSRTRSRWSPSTTPTWPAGCARR